MTAGFAVEDNVAVSKVLFLLFGGGLFASMKEVAPRCWLEDLQMLRNLVRERAAGRVADLKEGESNCDRGWGGDGQASARPPPAGGAIDATVWGLTNGF